MDITANTDELLFDYQKRIINDTARYILLEKSRRIGGTFIFAFKTIIECLQNDWNGWFSSNDYKNGLEFIKYVKEWSGVINAIMGFDYIDITDSTTEEVRLPNGKSITSLSSNPAALRGKDGIIILDEVASRDDQQEVLTAAQGCVIQKGKLYLLSTHNGPATVFYNIAEGAPANGWSKHKVTLMDALEDGYAVRFAKHLKHLGEKKSINEAFIKEIKSITLNDAQYKQEYLCEPLSLQSLIRPEDYDAIALWDVLEAPDPSHAYNPLHVGIDVGRTHDKTYAWFFEEWENTKATNEYDRYDYKVIAVKEIHNQTIPQQWAILSPMLHHPSVSSIAIDQGTVGRSLADLVLEHFSFALMLSFTAPLKAKMAERVNGYVQYKRVSMPNNRPEIREDILAMRRQVGKTGNVIYDGNTAHSHCDAFWSCAMALEAANRQAGVTMVA